MYLAVKVGVGKPQTWLYIVVRGEWTVWIVVGNPQTWLYIGVSGEWSRVVTLATVEQV